jgi:plasmid maintenance system killer protein
LQAAEHIVEEANPELFTSKSLSQKSGIQAAHANKLARQLARLHVAKKWEDMNITGWGLHPLNYEAQFLGIIK